MIAPNQQTASETSQRQQFGPAREDCRTAAMTSLAVLRAATAIFSAGSGCLTGARENENPDFLRGKKKRPANRAFCEGS